MTERPTPDVRRGAATPTEDAPASACPICGAVMASQRAMLHCRRCGFSQCATCTGEVADPFE